MPEETTGPARSNPDHGVKITGELLGVSEGKPYADRNSQMHTPGIVDLLVGRYVERIEFNDVSEAVAAIAGKKERDTVTIDVRPTGPWDAGAKRWGRVSYRGRAD